jgi:hypothetical protein
LRLTPKDGVMGAWRVTTGPLNSILILRKRQEKPGFPTLARDDSPINPTSRTIELLHEMRKFNPQGDWAQLYELRMYTIYPGMTDLFQEKMQNILPVRESYSPNAGSWRAASGNVDRVYHLWAYTDLSQRNGLRPRIEADAMWRAYIGEITPMLSEMDSMLLAPLSLDITETA